LAASSQMNRIAERQRFLVLYPEQGRLAKCGRRARVYEDRPTRVGKRSRREASEAALDALAEAEKRQDHENDDDQADDIDDAVHEVTSLCRLSEPVAFKKQRLGITRFNCTCRKAGALYAGAHKRPRHLQRANGRWRITARLMLQITPAHCDV
jgi:hypothetical protein